ncbi:MAG TPA: hypothetical protein VNC61_00445 [Acidimicrobiales bacterium]|nr:hypothetical protein [Acidimicrobiales bacterium]
MTTPVSDDDSVPVTELTYTEASRELDVIVGFFEQREVDVDQLVVRLERAAAIVDELDRRVRKTRAQVEELVPRLEAVNRDQLVVTDEEEHDEGASDEADADEPEDVDGSEMIGDLSEVAEEGDEQALF